MVLTPFGKKVIKSGAWVFITNILKQSFFLIRLIVLARLLAPGDFGLFGIALVTLAALDTFSQIGFREALIQKKEDTDSFLDTAWTVGVVRGFLLAGILFAMAPSISFFFKTPQAKSVLQAICLAIVFRGFINITALYFEKKLEFHKYSFYQMAGAIADVVVSVSAAIILRSVWALVFGRIARELVLCVASYVIDPYRPRFRFDLEKAKSLFGFGKWVMASSALIFLLNQGDDIFVGKLLGVAALGFYQMAYHISNMPATQITHVISQVTFPAYAKVQDNIERLRGAYLMTLRATAFLAFPIAGLMFILAGDFTRIFLSEKWMPMVPAMQVLCVYGAIRSINATVGPILHGVGKPEIQTRLSAVQLIVMVVLIYPLSVRWGIVGTSFAVVIPAVLALVMIVREIKHIIAGAYKDFAVRIFPPAIAVLVMLFVALAQRRMFAPINSIGGFIVTLVFLGSVYLAVVYAGYGKSRRAIMMRTRNIIGSFLNRKK